MFEIRLCRNFVEKQKSWHLLIFLRGFELTTLTFYGAVNEIGGNKIFLEDDGTRKFLDFGMSFGKANKYFSEFLQR